ALRPRTVMRLAHGTTDPPPHVLPSWRKATQAGRALDHNLALPLVVAAPTISRSGRPMPAAVLGLLTTDVLDAFPVGTAPLDFSHALARVARIVSPPTCTTGEK